MKTLSLCMIVKNEEHCLGTCLEHAKEYADEIVIVDTGSNDKTKEIAKKFTDKVYDFEWVFDFSKARNYSFDRATSQYLMWLDADDVVPISSIKKIQEWKKSEEDCDVLICPYVNGVDSEGKPAFQFNRERIVKNDKRFRFKDRVHEVIVPSGDVKINEEIVIFHNSKKKRYTSRNLDIYQKMIADEESFSPRSQFYYARELLYNGQTDKAINQFSKFLAEGKGWKENNIEACLNLAKCYQIQKENKKALAVLFGSFVYDLPRGEVLYEIANIYFSQDDFLRAIYYYKLCLESKPNLNSGGFVNVDCYNFLPALQLCLCYNKIGDNFNSLHYHEVSKCFKPNDKRVKYNEKYFHNLK